MMRPSRILIAGLILATAASAASAAPPEVVRFHGVISQLGGQPVQDGNYTFRAEIFTEATGGTAIYTQTTTASVSAGAYTVVLSPTTAGQLNDAFADSPRFLQITVVSGPGVVNPETLLPRQEIASVPFAVAAASSDSAAVADALSDPTPSPRAWYAERTGSLYPSDASFRVIPGLTVNFDLDGPATVLFRAEGTQTLVSGSNKICLNYYRIVVDGSPLRYYREFTRSAGSAFGVFVLAAGKRYASAGSHVATIETKAQTNDWRDCYVCGNEVGDVVSLSNCTMSVEAFFD